MWRQREQQFEKSAKGEKGEKGKRATIQSTPLITLLGYSYNTGVLLCL
jgi:hypothetical protein